MTEQNVDLDALKQQVAALTAALTQQQPAAAQPIHQQQTGLTAWAQPAAPSMQLSIIGVSVPVEVQTQAGKARCYLALPPECASNMQMLANAITTLINAGIPVAAWESRQQQSFGSNRYYRR